MDKRTLNLKTMEELDRSTSDVFSSSEEEERRRAFRDGVKIAKEVFGDFGKPTEEKKKSK